MTPELMEEGARRLQAHALNAAPRQTESGGRTADYGRPARPGEVDVTHGRILYLEDVSVSFDGFKAINGLNLDIAPGELRCVIGPNGAGKTTMMDIITGKTRPGSGTVFFGSTIDPARHGDFLEAPRVGTVRAADDDDKIALPGQCFDGILAVLGGVTDVVLLRPLNIGELLPECADDDRGIIDRERGLGDEGKPVRGADLQVLHIFRCFDEIHAIAALPHRTFDFRMALVADHHHLARLVAHFGDLDMHLGDQQAGCANQIDIAQPENHNDRYDQYR